MYPAEPEPPPAAGASLRAGVVALDIQFASTDGARSLQLAQQSYYDAAPSITVRFAVPAGDGHGYDVTKVDSGGKRESIVVARDNNIVVFMEFYYPKPDSPDHAYETALTRTMLDALR